MNDETLQVFSGSAITPEELLVLAEFAAPSHFVSDEHLHDAAENLAEWTDHRVSTIHGALRLARATRRARQRRRAAPGGDGPVSSAPARARVLTGV